MKKLLLLAGATLVMAACSEAPSSPTGPRLSPRNAASHDEELICRSGYIIAYDEDGNPYCKADDTETSSVRIGLPTVVVPVIVPARP